MGSATQALRPYARRAIEEYRRARRLPEDHRRYREYKRRHLDLLRAERGPGPDFELIRALDRDGIVVVREFVTCEAALAMAGEVRATMEEIGADRYDGPLQTRRDDRDGVYRLYGADEALAPRSRDFFRSPFIAAIADALALPGTHVADAYVDYKAKIGGHDESVDYHIDHWKLRFKAFLLLADVTEEHAPMVYVEGSHRDARWRRRPEWAYQRRGSANAVLSPRRVARLRTQYGYDERVLTGRAGDLILVDTRGIHRGSELQHGTRLQFVSLFVVNGPPEYAR